MILNANVNKLKIGDVIYNGYCNTPKFQNNPMMIIQIKKNFKKT